MQKPYQNVIKHSEKSYDKFKEYIESFKRAQKILTYIKEGKDVTNEGGLSDPIKKIVSEIQDALQQSKNVSVPEITTPPIPTQEDSYKNLVRYIQLQRQENIPQPPRS